MNGPHDLGGMQGFGPVVADPDDRPFHEPWERRAFALTLAMGAGGVWTIDQSRAARESIGHVRYLNSSYYQIWLAGLDSLLVANGLASQDEIVSGRPSLAPRPTRVLIADQVAVAMAKGSPTERPASMPARFAPGDRVRAQNRHPVGHTRLPRYVRGHLGRIATVHGVHVFADANAGGAGAAEQWLYSVEFDAAELWGGDTTAHSVHVDCWESYLSPVDP